METEEKIFLLTKGHYSDYHVCGVYSSLKKAEEAKIFFIADNIEELIIDSVPEHPKDMFLFEVSIYKNGDINFVERGSPEYQDLKEPSWEPYGDHKTVYIKTWARDEEHAIKIANEIRSMLIATNQWTTNWNEWKSIKKLNEQT